MATVLAMSGGPKRAEDSISVCVWGGEEVSLKTGLSKLQPGGHITRFYPARTI